MCELEDSVGLAEIEGFNRLDFELIVDLFLDAVEFDDLRSVSTHLVVYGFKAIQC